MNIEKEAQEKDQQAARQAELKEVWMRAWVAAIERDDKYDNGSSRDLAYRATTIADSCLMSYTDRFGV